MNKDRQVQPLNYAVPERPKTSALQTVCEVITVAFGLLVFGLIALITLAILLASPKMTIGEFAMGSVLLLVSAGGLCHFVHRGINVFRGK